MAKEIKTNIVLGGKVAASLQKAFKATEKETQRLDKAFEVTKKIGVKAFTAVATSVAAIGTAVLASAEATRDYRKDLAKMYNNAEMAGMSQKEAWSGLEDLYAMSGEFDSANEAMSNLIATGYKGKDLEKIISAVNGATVKWQDTVTQESLADAINETVMSGKSIGQFDEILSRSGVNIDTFNDGLLACNGLAERQQYVLDWLAKSGLSEVNAAYQEQNKSITEAYKADLKHQNAMAELGKASEGLSTILKNLSSGAISYFANKIKNIDLASVSSALKRVGELGKQAFDLLWEALSKINWEALINAGVTVLSVFTSIFNFVVTNWDYISPIIWGIVAAMTAYKAITLAQKAATVISTIAQLGLNAAFLACPLTWILVGIGAIVAIFITLWKKCEGFRNFWKAAWDKIKEAFSIAKEKITNGFNAIKEKVQPIIDAVQTLIGKFKKLKDAIANSKVGKAFTAVKNGIGGAWDKITGNALGSTITSPTLTWVGEGGDAETIVPHNNKPRSRALAAVAAEATGLNSGGVGGGGNTFVFSPQITVYGADSGEIRSLIEDERNKFIAQMEEWTQGRRRLAF